ncbi:MAG: CbiX/SirB N-terminal domain-containing protein [Thermodesulfovibrionia bacterium]|nr:CbiX/SirB N-terminal domain-containing protein [Thermodesulfovibrionia bacterium]
MEIIIIAAHGSPSKEASNVEDIAERLHRMIHTECNKDCVRIAYLQFNKPTITDAIERAVEDGADKIIIHPFFLSSGIHVTESIPKIIKEAEDIYPDVKFIYTEPLGFHNKLAEVVLERIKTVTDIKSD